MGLKKDYTTRMIYVHIYICYIYIYTRQRKLRLEGKSGVCIEQAGWRKVETF